MKSLRIKALTILFAITVLFTASAAIAKETVTNFDSVVTISENGSVLITEKITFNAEGDKIKHGIVRAIPVRYTGMTGVRRITPIAVNSLLLDGDECHYEQTTKNGITYIIMGNSDHVLQPGLHTFTFAYELKNAVRFLEEYDELYLYVTGNAWNFPILNASCTVVLPGKKPGEGLLSAEAYEGLIRTKGYQRAAAVKDNIAVNTKKIFPGEGLVAIYKWDKGIIPPPFWSREREMLIHAEISFIVFFLVLAWSLLAWFIWGRFPRKNKANIVIAPKIGTSPASVRMARDFVADRISLTADIIDLAVRGYLKIERQEQEKLLFFRKTRNDYVLHKLKESGEGRIPLPLDEKAVFNEIFSQTDRVKLSSNSDKAALANAMNVLTAHMEAKAHTWVSLNLGLSFVSVGIMLLGAAAVFWFNKYGTLDLFYCGTMTIITFILALNDPRNKGLSAFVIILFKIFLILLAGGTFAFVTITEATLCYLLQQSELTCFLHAQ